MNRQEIAIAVQQWLWDLSDENSESLIMTEMSGETAHFLAFMKGGRINAEIVA